MSICIMKNAIWFFGLFYPNLKLAVECDFSLKIGVRSQGRSYHGWFVGGVDSGHLPAKPRRFIGTFGATWPLKPKINKNKSLIFSSNTV